LCAGYFAFGGFVFDGFVFRVFGRHGTILFLF
jgi:hypothetical protein